MLKEEVKIETAESNFENIEGNIEKLPQEILKNLENNNNEEEKLSGEISTRVEESNQDFQKETAEGGILSSLGEKIKKNKLMRAALVGLSLYSANPAFASGLETVLNNTGTIKSSQETSRGEDRHTERIELVKSIKDEFSNHINSRDYLNKLTGEFNGDSDRAKKEQSERLKRVQKVKIDANSDTKTWTEELKNSKATGYYDAQEEKIYIDKSLPNYLFSDRLRHEISHASTIGRIDMSEKAKEKMSSAYQSPNKSEFDESLGEKTSYGLKDEYLSSPEEMLARKQQLDIEMEKLGIKKYGEKFTQEHYEKMMKAYQDGIFSDDANIFIEIIKKDPDTFKDILNNIAKNDTKGKIKKSVA